MSKAAVVVQRCHESIVGGSEALAWQYAQLLSAVYEVEVLTTTALDYVTWSEALPAGVEKRQGVAVRRFPVTIGRTPYWHQLHERMLRHRDAGCAGAWGLGLQEELIRFQGPYSAPLVRHLEDHGDEYRVILFTTYLYPTTYFGANAAPSRRSLLAPTLHDEPFAHLSAYRFMARRLAGMLWLTEAERDLSRQLWGDLPGRVTAMAVGVDPAPPAQPGYPYLLYSGRLDPAKGCDLMLDRFRRWKQRRPSPVRLVLTGDGPLQQKEQPDVVFRGQVSEGDKFALMAGAAAFIMPSPWESFSVATLEAMAQKTPVLVNAESAVLNDHVVRSGAGRVFSDEESFCAGLNDLLGDERRRVAMGARGREYVTARYQTEVVRTALLEEVELRTRPSKACA